MNRGLRSVLFAVTVVFCVSLITAGDFWDKKPADKWTDKELVRIVSDSAWSQLAPFTAHDGGNYLLRNSRQTTICPEVDAAMAAKDGRSSQVGGSINMVLVRWESALPVKHALLRMGFLGRSPTPQQVQSFLAPNPKHYVVSVSGLSMKGTTFEPEHLAQMATLRRKDQDPVYAESSEILTDGESTLLRFRFPRNPPLQLSDRKVEFVLNFPKTRVNKSFDLRKMGFGNEALAL